MCTVARERWSLLASIVKKKQKNMRNNSVSVRRFDSFGLLKFELVDKNGWSWVSFADIDIDLKLKIRLLSENNIEALTGFNNTGNVCVWPAEEIMAFYCIKNEHKFNGKTVCELGAGMTGLAGLCVANCSNAKRVILTDGNERSVDNLILTAAAADNKSISCQILVWGSHSDYNQFEHKVDIILAADCLFFDDGRQPLLETLCSMLKCGGVALLFAPRRNGTLDKFVSLVRMSDKFSQIELITNYDSLIESKHQEFMESNPNYETDLHYPLLLRLVKKEEV